MLSGGVKLPLHQPIPIIRVDQAGEHEIESDHFMRLPHENCLQNLPKPKFSVVEDYNPSPMPVFPPPYIQFKQNANENLFDAVDYEMDEVDMAWLEARNVSRHKGGLQPVSEDDFELLVDRFEKENFLYMKATGKPEVTEADDDAICLVCLEGDCDDTNLILFCDLCNLPVHQDCYGVPYIPEGQWLCRKCFQSPNEDVHCVLCPNSGGAFKQTDRGHWAHTLCAMWVPGIHFGNPEFMEPIEGIENIPAANLKSHCYICKMKNEGATVFCQKRNCKLSFHATCLQPAGLPLKLLPDGTIIKQDAFCWYHSPLGASEKKEITNSRKNINDPTVPLDKIQDISNLVAFECKGQFVLRLLAYWKLKRILRSGAPLLRRLETPPDTNAGYEKFEKLLVELYKKPNFNSSLKLLERYCNWEREQKSMRRNSCTALTSYDNFVAKFSSNLDLSPGNVDYVVNILNQLMELAKSISDVRTRAKRIQIVDILIRRVYESKPQYLPRSPINLTEDSNAQEVHKRSTTLKYDGMLQHTNSSTDAVLSVSEHNQNNLYQKNSPVASRKPSYNITEQANGNPSLQQITPPNDECDKKYLSEIITKTEPPEPLHETCVLLKTHSMPLTVGNEAQKFYLRPAGSKQEAENMGSTSKMESNSQQYSYEVREQGNYNCRRENPHAQSNQFNALDIVWAKCQGYPWYPAMVINPEMPDMFTINGLSIPNPPEDVVALAAKKSGLLHLVCYFDRQRTWEWLPASKLRQLGNKEVDKKMLAFSHLKSKRREVQKAYYKACRQQSILNL